MFSYRNNLDSNKMIEVAKDLVIYLIHSHNSPIETKLLWKHTLYVRKSSPATF